MKCSICENEITGHVVTRTDGFTYVPYEGGNNAAPVNDGRCCDKCNLEVVIPARLELMFKKDKPACQHTRVSVAVRHESGSRLLKCDDCGTYL